MSEVKFLKKMTQRHDVAQWKHIDHITAIFREHNKFLKIYRLKFETRKYIDHPLYLKAKEYLRNLVNNHTEDNVLEDFAYTQKLEEMSPTNYCIYITCKLVWFFEIIRKRHISKMMIDFAKTAKDEYWIMGIKNIHHRQADPSNLKRFSIRRLEYRDPQFRKRCMPRVSGTVSQQEFESMTAN